MSDQWQEGEEMGTALKAPSSLDKRGQGVARQDPVHCQFLAATAQIPRGRQALSDLIFFSTSLHFHPGLDRNRDLPVLFLVGINYKMWW